MNDDFELSAETRNVEDVLLLRDNPAMGWGVPFSSDEDTNTGPVFYALALGAVNLQSFIDAGGFEKAMALDATRYVFLLEKEEVKALKEVVDKVWKEIENAED